MPHGLIQAGINVFAGIDLDFANKETYEFNNPVALRIRFWQKEF